MTSLPNPPMRASEPPRPRISSSPSKPSSSSGLSVPKSRPPLGQPGKSLVTHRPDGPCRSMGRVSAHRASSEAALAERVCSLVASVCPCCLGLSELVPEQPTTRRRTAHPIRKVPTKAMLRPWRTTTPSPSLRASPATSASKHATLRSPALLCCPYSPKCVEGEFSEVYTAHSTGRDLANNLATPRLSRDRQNGFPS